MLTYEPHTVAPHDVIEVAGRRVGDAPRTGEILEVLGTPEHPHYRVRWDDDHESVFYPAGDTRIGRSERAPTHAAIDPGPLVPLLREADVEFELLPHRRTETAKGEAQALGVLPQETAKTVIASIDDGCVRAVVSASSRLDLGKLATALGSNEAALLSEADLVRAYPQFELGAVPPFGGPDGDAVVIDSGLSGCEYVVLEAGTHDTSLRLRMRDLVAVSRAQIADIAAS